MITMEIARERVTRGMALLDAHVPGWEERIDLSMLNIASACNCVCGQLRIWAAPFLRALDKPGSFKVVDEAYTYEGRLIHYGMMWERLAEADEDSALLTAAWREGVEARLAVTV